jgi:hypothetical protein
VRALWEPPEDPIDDDPWHKPAYKFVSEPEPKPEAEAEVEGGPESRPKPETSTAKPGRKPGKARR